MLGSFATGAGLDMSVRHASWSFSFDVTVFIASCSELTIERPKGRRADSALHTRPALTLAFVDESELFHP